MAWYVLYKFSMIPGIVRPLVTESDQGRLPALGWNSWNAFGCDVNASAIMTAANQIVNLGLQDMGYEYVNSKI